MKAKILAKDKIQRLKTTQELAEQFNTKLNHRVSQQHSPVNQMSSLNSNSLSNSSKSHFPNIACDHATAASKSELMQRFLLSTHTNSATALLNSNEDSNDEVISGDSVSRHPSVQPHHFDFSNHSDTNYVDEYPHSLPEHAEPPHYPHPHVTLGASFCAAHLSQGDVGDPDLSVVDSRPGVRDSVNDEIRDILSRLPPVRFDEIVWSDNDEDEEGDEEGGLEELNEYDTNGGENGENGNLDSFENNDDNVDDADHSSDERHFRTRRRKRRLMQRRRKVIEVSEHDVENVLESRWDGVNGTYDAETDWHEWHQMTNATTHDGELLHILPYVNIKLYYDDNGDKSEATADEVQD